MSEVPLFPSVAPGGFLLPFPPLSSAPTPRVGALVLPLHPPYGALPALLNRGTLRAFGAIVLPLGALGACAGACG